MTTDRIHRHRYYDPDVEKVVPKDAPDAASVLREMAQAIPGSDVMPLSRSGVRTWLRARADELEAGESA